MGLLMSDTLLIDPLLDDPLLDDPQRWLGSLREWPAVQGTARDADDHEAAEPVD
jgi:hypothetical protein